LKREEVSGNNKQEIIQEVQIRGNRLKPKAGGQLEEFENL